MARLTFATLTAVAALSTACGGDKEDTGQDTTGEELPGGGDTDDLECGGTPPVVTSVQCEAAGLLEYEPGSSLPTLLFSIEVTDEDRDLENMSVELYFDDEVNGTVSTTESPYTPSIVTIDSTECVTPASGVNLTVFVSGVDPRFNTLYEWSIVVRDANDTAAEPFIIECITPFENGDAGNGEG